MFEIVRFAEILTSSNVDTDDDARSRADQTGSIEPILPATEPIHGCSQSVHDAPVSVPTEHHESRIQPVVVHGQRHPASERP